MANELYGSIMRGGVCYGGVGDPAMINQVSDNIAPKQATNIASELIPAGKYFVNSEGKLCQCDVQIASGGTIVVGSNCHLIPDGGVNELNSKMIGKVIYKDYVPKLSPTPTSWTVMMTLPVSYANLGIGTLMISMLSINASGAPTGIAVTPTNATPTESNSIIFQEGGISQEGTGFRCHPEWGSETFYIWAKWAIASAIQNLYLSVIDF